MDTHPTFSDVHKYCLQYLDANGVHRTNTFHFAANREAFLQRHGHKITNVIRSTWDRASQSYKVS